MKNLVLVGALFICSGSLYADDTGTGVAVKNNTTLGDYPKSATLVTPLSVNHRTPAAVALYAPESGCMYSGTLSETVSGDKSARVIDVNRKQCGSTVEKVDLTVPEIDAGKNYDQGITLKLYRSTIMTPAGPVMSPDMTKRMAEQIKEAIRQSLVQDEKRTAN
ncbi:hypothetical protein WKH15_21645 [Pantoea agglomerans]|uniref:hypothetical protein n=1 Tax=Enterobacter agglomerans TaxID=549 RepID=UPI003C7BF995